MNADRRWMFLRTAVWVGIGVYAVLLIRNPGMGDAVGKAALEATGLVKPEWTAVAPPPGTHRPPPTPGDAADALLLVSRLSTPECPVSGRELRLHLGPSGLESAEVLGTPPACLSEKVWQVGWPSMAPLELEVVAG